MSFEFHSYDSPPAKNILEKIHVIVAMIPEVNTPEL